MFFLLRRHNKPSSLLGGQEIECYTDTVGEDEVELNVNNTKNKLRFRHRNFSYIFIIIFLIEDDLLCFCSMEFQCIIFYVNQILYQKFQNNFRSLDTFLFYVDHSIDLNF